MYAYLDQCLRHVSFNKYVCMLSTFTWTVWLIDTEINHQSIVSLSHICRITFICIEIDTQEQIFKDENPIINFIFILVLIFMHIFYCRSGRRRNIRRSASWYTGWTRSWSGSVSYSCHSPGTTRHAGWRTRYESTLRNL